MIPGLPTIQRPRASVTADDAPLQIPDLGLWLRADFGVLNSISPNVAATDGQSVRKWLDGSGNGRDFEQSTASNQPALDADGIGGKPALDFDGVNDLLSWAPSGNDLFANKTGASVFVVAKPDGSSPSSDEYVFVANGGGAFSTRVGVLRDTGGDTVVGGRRLDADSYAEVIAGATTATAQIISGRFRLADAELDGFKDGDSTLLDPFQTTGNFSNTQGNAYAVGDRSGLGGRAFPGLVSEIIVYPRALTDQEIWTLHRYLSLRYSIPLQV